VLDARRNEVFYAFYKSSPGGIQRLTRYHVERPERLAVRIAAKPEEVLLVGNGALLYRSTFRDLGSGTEIAAASHSFPDAKALVELALTRMFRDDFDSVFQLTPLYLRRSAKPIQWERMRGSRTA
jgi:tRNA threonylcarbamoyladenosine biosynthesis protein TsaB